MSEQKRWKMSWLFVVVAGVAGATLLFADLPVLASDNDDHERARLYMDSGKAMPLAQLLGHPELAGLTVLEAELDHEHGRLVYELELLGKDGRVHERYFDAASGEPIAGKRKH